MTESIHIVNDSVALRVDIVAALRAAWSEYGQNHARSVLEHECTQYTTAKRNPRRSEQQ